MYEREREAERRNGDRGINISQHKYSVRDTDPVDRDTDRKAGHKVAKMYQLVVLNVLSLMLVRGQTVGTDDSCNRQEVKQGCRVDQGHAVCESWNLTSSIHGLPSCTTRITFSLLVEPNSINMDYVGYNKIQ